MENIGMWNDLVADDPNPKNNDNITVHSGLFDDFLIDLLLDDDYSSECEE